MTVAPWAFNFLDTASPIQEPAPVTTAISPLKSPLIGDLLSYTKPHSI